MQEQKAGLEAKLQDALDAINSVSSERANSQQQVEDLTEKLAKATRVAEKADIVEKQVEKIQSQQKEAGISTTWSSADANGDSEQVNMCSSLRTCP